MTDDASDTRRCWPCSPPLAAWPPRRPAAATGARRRRAASSRARCVVKFEGERRGAADRAARRASACARRRAALRRRPRVAYAAPNYIATASATPRRTAIPNDPGTARRSRRRPPRRLGLASSGTSCPGKRCGDAPAADLRPAGIDAVGAWRNLAAAGRPGAAGRHRRRPRHRHRLPHAAAAASGAAPTSPPGQFVHGLRLRRRRPPAARRERPRHPRRRHDRREDQQRHRPHRPRLPGEADAGPGPRPARQRRRPTTSPRGIRFAAAHGADVINMSFNFGCGKRVPAVDEALRYAYRSGVVAVASVGNLGSRDLRLAAGHRPAVIGVGGTHRGRLPRRLLAGRRRDRPRRARAAAPPSPAARRSPRGRSTR